MDYYQEYSSYKLSRLLLILAQKEAYQPAAVVAAQKVLRERSPTEAELAAAQQEMQVLLQEKQRPYPFLRELLLYFQKLPHRFLYFPTLLIAKIRRRLGGD